MLARESLENFREQRVAEERLLDDVDRRFPREAANTPERIGGDQDRWHVQASTAQVGHRLQASQPRQPLVDYNAARARRRVLD